MTSAVLLLGLLVGAPTAPASSRAIRPAGLSPGDARLLARHAEDPSRFNPCFGRSDPAAHVARFGAAAGGGAGSAPPPPSARDAAIKDALHKVRMTTSLQMSMQLK